MSHNVDVVKAWFELSSSNWPDSSLEAVEKYYSDDFKSYDKQGNVQLVKENYIAMDHLMAAAFEDFKTVCTEIRDEGDGVFMRFHFEGKHVGDIDLSSMGLGVIPASGKNIMWPDASSIFYVKGDQIVSEQVVDSGLEWFLTPLGVKLPTA